MDKKRIEKSRGGYIPLFFEGNIDKNIALVNEFTKIAEEKNVTVSQLAYAWILSKGDDIIPLIGTSSPEHLKYTLKALNITLSENDIKSIEDSITENEIAGAAFPQMKFKNGKVVSR